MEESLELKSREAKMARPSTILFVSSKPDVSLLFYPVPSHPCATISGRRRDRRRLFCRSRPVKPPSSCLKRQGMRLFAEMIKSRKPVGEVIMSMSVRPVGQEPTSCVQRPYTTSFGDTTATPHHVVVSR
jgi:hypothetical protein